MPTPAPTIAEINAAGYEVVAHCRRCRRITPMNVKQLGAGTDARRRIDRLGLLCDECGSPGQAVVTAGSGATGRRRVWPL
jgi:hypothetical protein